MLNILLTLLMPLSFFACYAEIKQVYEMQEVFDAFKDADTQTLAIFDVDMVLVQPGDPAFQMANIKRYSAIVKRVMKELPADKHMLFLSLMTIGSDSVLIDEQTPQWIDGIIQRGIPAMAMTSNLTGQFGPISKMEQWRVDGLRQLGFNFARTAPCQSPLVFDNLSAYRGNYSLYLDGVLFVNGTTVSKGDALFSFLKKSGFHPNRVIFIDDREDNLKSVEDAIHSLNEPVAYQGIHYLGAQKYPSALISQEEFESRWLTLVSQVKELN